MTIGYYYKEYEIVGKTYYISQYAEKPNVVKFWEYGYQGDYKIGKTIYHNICITIRRGLRSRPNLKRLFGD